MGKYKVTTDGGVYMVTTEDDPPATQSAASPAGPPVTSRFALGKTDISADSPFKAAVRNIAGYLPDLGAAVGGTVGALPGLIPGVQGLSPWMASTVVPAATGVGALAGQTAQQAMGDVMRPPWMEKPSTGEKLGGPLEAGAKGVAQGFLGELTGGLLNEANLAKPFSLKRTPYVADQMAQQQGGKLATQAVKPSAPAREFAARVGEALPYIDAERKLVGAAPITTAEEGARHAAATVSSLDNKAMSFIEPYLDHPAFGVNGDQLAENLMKNIPADMAIENPAAYQSIAAVAKGYEGKTIPLRDAVELLKTKNAKLSGMYGMTPADRYNAEFQKGIVVDKSVADSLRNAIYDKAESLSGPGMKELRRVQGGVIQLRDEFNKLADKQFVDGGFWTGVPESASWSKQALYAARHHWVSPDAKIRRAFEAVGGVEPSYPLAKPPVGGVTQQPLELSGTAMTGPLFEGGQLTPPPRLNLTEYANDLNAPKMLPAGSEIRTAGQKLPEWKAGAGGATEAKGFTVDPEVWLEMEKKYPGLARLRAALRNNPGSLPTRQVRPPGPPPQKP